MRHCSYGSNSRKRYTLRLLSMCLGRTTPHIGGKAFPSFDSLFDSHRWARFSLALHLCSSYVITKWCKIYTKTDSGFKNHMRNLDNFRQTVESPKSWNLMGYFCPKNTFLQLKHYIQRIYLTLLSTIVKTHKIPNVNFNSISHFSRHNLSVFFSSNNTYFW